MKTGIQPGMMKYCVVANIVTERVDENGVRRYGTAAFPGGRKIYISRRFWDDHGLTVLGMNRYKRYVIEGVLIDKIENIRSSKTFQPHLLELMTDTGEYDEMWWGYREEDKTEATNFAAILNEWKTGDREKAEKQRLEFMSQLWWYKNPGQK